MWVRGLKHYGSSVLRLRNVSHPMWVRGLKPVTERLLTMVRKVASYVGAWIETPMSGMAKSRCRSHPMWVRGLKLVTLNINILAIMSHPMWVRGLKLDTP